MVATMNVELAPSELATLRTLLIVDRGHTAAAIGRAIGDTDTITVRRHLDRVNSALGRLVDGSYGVCEVCHGDIPFSRLKARAYSRTCIACVESRGR